MLHEFLSAKRAELIDRCRAKTAQRLSPKATPKELEHGIPFFLDQLVKTLKAEQASDCAKSREVSGSAAGNKPGSSEIGVTAELHGRELLQQGYTIDQVVHGYGDVCQAISDLALEVGARIEVDEFRTLNRCLDNAMADAVTAFSSQRDSAVTEDGVQALNDRLGAMAHEMQTHVQAAALALIAIKTGKVGITGATGAVLDLSLLSLQTIIDRALADAQATPGASTRH